MKRLLVTFLIAGAFLGGYQLGRRPDSPDIVGRARQACDSLAALYREFAPAAGGEAAGAVGALQTPFGTQGETRE